MELLEFSRKGGQAKSLAKTRANRAKISIFWRKVRRGEVPPPRRHRKFPEPVRVLARRYIWWLPPEASLALPRRVVAQVMDIGTLGDCVTLQKYFSRAELRKTLRQAEAGWFRPRSWGYWHYRLGLTKWGAEPPPLPVRASLA